MITARQIRAARALLGWSQQQLADKAIVSLNAVARLEKGIVDSRISTVLAIQKALSKAGIEFLQKLVANNMRLPMIFYVVKMHEERGTPPYAFGITNSPSELVHLVMDVIERK